MNTVFRDIEIRDYLAGIVDDGCSISYMMMADLERYQEGKLNKKELLNYLQEAWVWQLQQKSHHWHGGLRKNIQVNLSTEKEVK